MNARMQDCLAQGGTLLLIVQRDGNHQLRINYPITDIKFVVKGREENADAEVA